MSNTLPEIKKKYETFVSNIEWHIENNKPEGAAIERCTKQIECYKEFLGDLSSLSQEEGNVLGGKSKEDKLRESLEDLYNALDSIPNSRKSGTLAEHCDMELAKSLINQPRTQQEDGYWKLRCEAAEELIKVMKAPENLGDGLRHNNYQFQLFRERNHNWEKSKSQSPQQSSSVEGVEDENLTSLLYCIYGAATSTDEENPLELLSRIKEYTQRCLKLQSPGTDAVEFTEWLSENDYSFVGGGFRKLDSDNFFTTEQLYKIFKGTDAVEKDLVASVRQDSSPVATLRSSSDNSIEQFIGQYVSYDKEGQIIWGHDWVGNLQHLLDVRGWGAIQNLFKNKDGSVRFSEATKFQDEFAEWIVSAINAKLSSKQPTLTAPVPNDTQRH